MISTSSVVKQFLLSQAPGFAFTNQSLFEAISRERPEDDCITVGGVNGFCSKAATTHPEILSATRVGKIIHYVLLGSIEPISVRASSSAGGGHSGPRRSRPSRPTRDSIAAQLLQLAADLELIETDLAGVETEQLLKELMRRSKGAGEEK